AAGLPASAVRAAHIGELPRLDTGKPDRAAALDLVPAHVAPRPDGDLLALYADVLDRDDLTGDSSFVSAGGDSLSYVELSLRLEDQLGHLPTGWHTTAIRDLEPAASPRRCRTLETSVALRALAIVLVVCFHSNALAVVGGAHVLVGVAGFNLARFGLSPVPRRERLRHLAASATRIAVPTAVWAAGVALVTGDYGLPTVLHLNVLLGPDAFSPQWQLWFVEALLQLVGLVAVLVAVPSFDRLERRAPFAAAAALVGAGLLVRAGVVPLPGGPDGIHTAPAVLWLFALGWAAARASTRGRQALVSTVLLLALPGFFGDPQREAVVAVGLLALVWLPELPCPRVLRRLAGVLASSSLYVYLTHWQVYPHLEVDHPWMGVLASLAVGVLTWRVAEVVSGRLRSYAVTGRTEPASTQRR
ncbi:MAG: AMP-dependent synthetase and ligase, partial [Frankiales bacterium]|nr:AMP-dependent synthetase and ligase [Frankiales bacterium]